MAAKYLPPDLFYRLFECSPLEMKLCPQEAYDPNLTVQIANLKLVDGSDAPRPLIASLHLLNDDVKAAHSIAENMYDNGIYEADYQHGISHIRDADYGNSRRWFRRLTRMAHPVLSETFLSKPAEAAVMKEAGQAAKLFVDVCQQVDQGTSPEYRLEQELYRQMKATAEWSIQEYVAKKQ
ncbi:hypothetical protein FRC09_001420 [Ceratobasidium sp. 395]|nr:hypothetical protein FRC09_001420 [Ceratobasidium sp. 395]